MKPIQGINQLSSGIGACSNPFILAYQQSCTLSLEVSGSALAGDVLGGPIVCEQGSVLQCYQPGLVDSLNIHLIPVPPQQYTVVPSAGAHGSISPDTPQVVGSGQSLSFTALPNSGYAVEEWFVDGNPVQAGGTTYSLVDITANHTVNVTFIAQYTITPSSGPHGSISPNTAQLVNAGGDVVFTATADAQYGVYQWLVDGNLEQAGGSTYTLSNIQANHSVEVIFALALHPGVEQLALSVNCASSNPSCSAVNPALTGNPRHITFTNLDTVPATNLTVTSSGLPSGTTVSATTCTGNLNPGDSCTVTITPGPVANPNASSNPCTSGGPPTASTVTVTANNNTPASVDILVLGYGCVYQQGFIFAVDDTTPASGSIGGKVLAMEDQATFPPNLLWSSNGLSSSALTDVSFDVIPGIDDYSTSTAGEPSYATFAAWFAGQYPTLTVLPSSAFRACDGAYDGQCNTANIVAFYNEYLTHVPESNPPQATPWTDYAAGLCKQTIDGYSDWYLPAVCELELNSNFGDYPGGGCAPYTQNIQDALPFLIGPYPRRCHYSATACLGAGLYWSSTEFFCDASHRAWVAQISSSGGGFYYDNKTGTVLNNYGVRCARRIIY